MTQKAQTANLYVLKKNHVIYYRGNHYHQNISGREDLFLTDSLAAKMLKEFPALAGNFEKIPSSEDVKAAKIAEAKKKDDAAASKKAEEEKIAEEIKAKDEEEKQKEDEAKKTVKKKVEKKE